jgi:hypothetical protein
VVGIYPARLRGSEMNQDQVKSFVEAVLQAGYLPLYGHRAEDLLRDLPDGFLEISTLWVVDEDPDYPVVITLDDLDPMAVLNVVPRDAKPHG